MEPDIRILKASDGSLSDDEMQLIEKLSVAIIDALMLLPAYIVPSVIASTVITFCAERLLDPHAGWDELATEIATGIQQALTIKRSEKH